MGPGPQRPLEGMRVGGSQPGEDEPQSSRVEQRPHRAILARHEGRLCFSQPRGSTRLTPSTAHRCEQLCPSVRARRLDVPQRSRTEKYVHPTSHTSKATSSPWGAGNDVQVPPNDAPPSPLPTSETSPPSLPLEGDAGGNASGPERRKLIVRPTTVSLPSRSRRALRSPRHLRSPLRGVRCERCPPPLQDVALELAGDSLGLLHPLQAHIGPSPASQQRDTPLAQTP